MAFVPLQVKTSDTLNGTRVSLIHSSSTLCVRDRAALSLWCALKPMVAGEPGQHDKKKFSLRKIKFSRAGKPTSSELFSYLVNKAQLLEERPGADEVKTQRASQLRTMAAQAIMDFHQAAKKNSIGTVGPSCALAQYKRASIKSDADIGKMLDAAIEMLKSGRCDDAESARADMLALQANPQVVRLNETYSEKLLELDNGVDILLFFLAKQSLLRRDGDEADSRCRDYVGMMKNEGYRSAAILALTELWTAQNWTISDMIPPLFPPEKQ